MSWMEIYNAAFFITIATIVTGFIGIGIRYCLKSKCDQISVCFGLLNITRRVDLEVQTEMAEIDAGMRRNPSLEEPPSPSRRQPLDIQTRQTPV